MSNWTRLGESEPASVTGAPSRPPGSLSSGGEEYSGRFPLVDSPGSLSYFLGDNDSLGPGRVLPDYRGSRMLQITETAVNKVKTLMFLVLSLEEEQVIHGDLNENNTDDP